MRMSLAQKSFQYFTCLYSSLQKKKKKIITQMSTLSLGCVSVTYSEDRELVSTYCTQACVWCLEY